MLPLMVNISVALCTYTAKLFMYIVSMIGMVGEIQFVCFIVYNNKHINCFSLLIEGKDPVRCRYIYIFSLRLPSLLMFYTSPVLVFETYVSINSQFLTMFFVTFILGCHVDHSGRNTLESAYFR